MQSFPSLSSVGRHAEFGRSMSLCGHTLGSHDNWGEEDWWHRIRFRLCPYLLYCYVMFQKPSPELRTMTEPDTRTRSKMH